MVYVNHKPPFSLSFALLFLLIVTLPILNKAAAAAQQCGYQNPTGTCSAEAPCCSQWGFCGASEYYCDPAYKCQSRCWNNSIFKESLGHQNPHLASTTSFFFDAAQFVEENEIDPDESDPNGGSSGEAYGKKLDAKRQKRRYDWPKKADYDVAPYERGRDDPDYDHVAKSENPHFDERGMFSSCALKGVVSLTYDDGPSDYTEMLLDVLAKYKVKATFFVIGENINCEERKRILRRIYDEGHIVASHTWSHPHLKEIDSYTIRKEMQRTARRIREVIGVYPRYMRPPYGETNDKVRKLLFGLGYKIIMWNMDTNDWKYHNHHPEKIFSEFEKQFGKYKNLQRLKSWIPLQHDMYLETVQLQEKIIQYVLSAGYRIIPLNECIRDRDPIYR